VEENDEIDNGQGLEQEVKGKGEDIIFVRMRACGNGETAGPEIVPGCKIIVIGDGIIQRIGENIVPLPDIILVKGEEGEIQDRDQKNRKNIIDNISG
jgi:hypothetical protein